MVARPYRLEPLRKSEPAATVGCRCDQTRDHTPLSTLWGLAAFGLLGLWRKERTPKGRPTRNKLRSWTGATGRCTPPSRGTNHIRQCIQNGTRRTSVNNRKRTAHSQKVLALGTESPSKHPRNRLQLLRRKVSSSPMLEIDNLFRLQKSF